MSDHGEKFYEHGGWQHMKAPYAESVRSPFIVKLPGARPSWLGRTGISVVDGDWKMAQIRLPDQPDPPPELYNIAHDPGGRIDVAADYQGVVGYLRDALRIHESGGSGLEAGESEIDDELRRELRALGYLD